MIWISPNQTLSYQLVWSTQSPNKIDIETKTLAWTKFPMDQKSLWSKSLGGENVWGPKCPGAEMSRGRNVHVPKRPWCQNVRVPKRPWGRNVQGPKRLGAETSRCRNVLGAETSTCRNVLGAETSTCRNVLCAKMSSCQNVLGAEKFGPKCPLPKFFGPKPDEAIFCSKIMCP